MNELSYNRSMSILEAIILGIVEGLTEFLPISSTFHLIFTGKLLSIPDSEFLKMFQVFIQAGAILAVLVLYGKKLVTNRKLMLTVIASFIPTAIVGFLLHSFIKNVLFESVSLMISALVGIGIFFIVYEYFIVASKKKLDRTIDSLTILDAIYIGLGQALAVLPGVSRAGAVIVAMMFLKVKRSEAAEYSFLLALPTICAAAAYDLFKLETSTALNTSEITTLVVGFVTAFIFALLVLKWFINYLQKKTLTNFGIYRILAGIVLSLIFLF